MGGRADMDTSYGAAEQSSAWERAITGRSPPTFSLTPCQDAILPQCSP